LEGGQIRDAGSIRNPPVFLGKKYFVFPGEGEWEFRLRFRCLNFFVNNGKNIKEKQVTY
jgi:hypothetical protein